MGNDDDRSGVVTFIRWLPTRVVVIVGVAMCLALNLVEISRHGLDADNWGMLADMSEVILPLLAAVLLAKRGLAPMAGGEADELDSSEPGARSLPDSPPRFDMGVDPVRGGPVAGDTIGRRQGWLWLSAGALAWACGQISWVVLQFGFGKDPTVSVSSVAFVGWSLFTATGLIKIGGLSKSAAAVRPMVGEAILLAMAIGFLVWELALARDITNESNFTVVLLAAVPISTSFVIAIALLLSAHERSAVLGIVALAGTVLVLGDSFLTVEFADGASLYAVAHLLYLTTFALIAIASVLPHHPRPNQARSGPLRICLVYVPLTFALWVATWHFLIDSRPATIVSIGIAALVGVLLLGTQVAHWRHSQELSGQLDTNVERLETTESQLRELLDDLPEAVVVVAADGSIRDLNAHTLEITGRTHADLIGQPFLVLVREQNRRNLYRTWRQLIELDPLANPVFALLHADGSEVMVEADVRTPIVNLNRVVVTLRDITNRLEAASALEQAQTRFGLAFRSAPTGMAMASADSFTLIDVNDALAQMLGYARDELIGRPISSLTHSDDLVSGRARDGDVRFVRNDGQIVWAHTSVGMMTDTEGRDIAIMHVQDITDQRQAAAHLQWAASHDELTGLPNRTHFLEQLRRRLDGAELGSIAVLFIDLDNFKVVNDSLGHAIGDELLRGMSERLRSVVRDRDMLGRFGGDEFIVLLDGLHMDMTPADVAERLRQEMARPLVVDDTELYVTGSIGIAYADRIGVTADELLRDADAAMYRAKTRGRDCVEAFAPGAHETSVLALRTASELRHGLERGEIVPYYQPIVDLASGQLTGFEVLARWRHPDRGLLGPDQFLPMAEETGLITELGASILRASLAQLGLWQANVPSLADVSISVNVSVRQLVDSRFHTVVAEALAETGVLADSLWLEITETALMSDVKAATIALRNLRSLGLHLSVDDFGTGYSSLTYLKRFPVEAIKVDRQFVKGLGIVQEDTTIVEAVVNLGRSLGLMVVAEGVETPLQLTRLRETGCDRAQGYLFGRPRPAALIEAERSGATN